MTRAPAHLEPIFEGHPFKDNLTVGIVDMQTPYAFVTGPGGKLIPMPKDMEKPAGKWTVLYCHCKEHGMVIQSIKNDPQDLVRCLKDVQAEFEAREEEEKKKAERADCS